jgi:hypothetical protein
MQFRVWWAVLSQRTMALWVISLAERQVYAAENCDFCATVSTEMNAEAVNDLNCAIIRV